MFIGKGEKEKKCRLCGSGMESCVGSMYERACMGRV